MQNGFGCRGQAISQGQRPQDSRLSYALARFGLALFVLLSILSLCLAPAASAAGAILPDTPADLAFVSTSNTSVVKLNAPLAANGDVNSVQISPDSSRVVYRVDQEADEVYELYSVPIGGGSAVKLNAPLVANGYVSGFQISPNSSQVVYQADQETEEVYELYSTLLWTSDKTVYLPVVTK